MKGLRRKQHDLHRSLVGFVVAGSHYALPIAGVKQIVQPAAISPLSGVAKGVIGYADHRGDVAMVVDLRTYFGQPRAPKGVRPKWIILDVNEYQTELTDASSPQLVGLVVDRVTEVFGTAGASLEATSHPEVEHRGISGVLNRGGDLVFMLNVAHFTNLPKLSRDTLPGEDFAKDRDDGARTE